MRAVVVYESMFGSTRTLAEEVGAGLRECGVVAEVVEVGEQAAREGALPEADLLVVGAPTHAFGLSRSSTREDARKELPTPLVSPGIGVREWLEQLGPVNGTPFATFDTKVRTPDLPGSAAKGAHKRLRHAGGTALAPARTFRVNGKADGLVDGERAAAHAWGAELGRALTAAR